MGSGVAQTRWRYFYHNRKRPDIGFNRATSGGVNSIQRRAERNRHAAENFHESRTYQSTFSVARAGY